MRILISGVHGYIGRNLVKLLQHSHTIYGLDYVTSEMEGVKKTFTCAEISSIPDLDVVMHVAGKTVESYDLSKSLEYFESNAGLTRNIFRWFVHSNAKMFFYFSTVKAAADFLENGELTEYMEPKPFGPFGESKLLAEKYILEEWPAGKKVYILRSAILHGPGRIGSNNLSMIYGWAKKGLPLPFGRFGCHRSFTSLDNLYFVLIKMLEKDIPGGIYNVTDDETLALNEIYELMSFSLHKKAHILYLDEKLVHFFARLFIRFNNNYSELQLQRLTSSFVVSNNKIKNALGIKKMPHSLVDSYIKTLSSFNKDLIV